MAAVFRSGHRRGGGFRNALSRCQRQFRFGQRRYYKDGKHIDLDLKRDTAAVERSIRGQALINPDGSAVRVYVSGRFDDKVPLKLTLLHPVKKEYDQSIGLKLSTAPKSGDKTEYLGQFAKLPPANHWYVRLEDEGGIWRVENNGLSARGLRLI